MPDLFHDNVRLAYKTANNCWKYPFVQANHGTLEDVQQLALITLFKCSRGFKAELGWKFSTYAVNAMRNEILRHKGGKNRLQSHSLDVGDHPGEWESLGVEDDPAKKLERAEVASCIRSHLNHLPEGHRRVTCMIYGIGCREMTHREIAEAMGCTKSRIDQIRDEVIARLRWRLTGQKPRVRYCAVCGVPLSAFGTAKRCSRERCVKEWKRQKAKVRVVDDAHETVGQLV